MRAASADDGGWGVLQIILLTDALQHAVNHGGDPHDQSGGERVGGVFAEKRLVRLTAVDADLRQCSAVGGSL